MHWAPTWVTAGVCKPSYLPDIIIHMENLGNFILPTGIIHMENLGNLILPTGYNYTHGKPW